MTNHALRRWTSRMGLGCAAVAFGCSQGGSTSGSSPANAGAWSAMSGGSAASAVAGAVSAVGSSAGASVGGSTGGSAPSSHGGDSGQTSAVAGEGGAGSPAGAGGVVGEGGTAGIAGGFGGVGGGGEQPGVRVVGRTAPGTNGVLRFSWPGVNIHARFTGTQVSMSLNDGNNKNRFTVVIDGGPPKTFVTSTAQTVQLASGLPNQTHDIVVWRNTEASPGGVTQFSGLTTFGADGALLAPTSPPARRIEVIGDSLSVGAGVEGTSTNCTPDINAFTNNYLAYGSVAARAVNADVATIAWSGIGVYRSYGGSAPTMPERYDYAIPNDGTAWDFSKYQPNVVVVNLGTNDFSSGNPGQPYVDAYVSFVQHVRSKYAQANFILIDMYGGDRLTALNSVVAKLKSAGEQRVEILSFSSVPNNNTACNQHPNATAQAAMGALLANRLKSSLGW